MKRSSYTIIDKDGNIVESQDFSDYDALADHMLQLADKWYEGIEDPDQKITVSSYNEEGEIIYTDSASFGDNRDVELEFERSEHISDISDFRYEVEGI